MTKLDVRQLDTTGTPDGTKVLRDDGAWVPPGGGASALDDLTDVDLTGEADGDFLSRVSGVWVPVDAPAGGGGGTGISAMPWDLVIDESLLDSDTTGWTTDGGSWTQDSTGFHVAAGGTTFRRRWQPSPPFSMTVAEVEVRLDSGAGNAGIAFGSNSSGYGTRVDLRGDGTNVTLVGYEKDMQVAQGTTALPASIPYGEWIKLRVIQQDRWTTTWINDTLFQVWAQEAPGSNDFALVGYNIAGASFRNLKVWTPATRPEDVESPATVTLSIESENLSQHPDTTGIGDVLKNGNRNYGDYVGGGVPAGVVDYIVDLGSVKEVDRVNWVLYWGDSRTYYNVGLYASVDGVTYVTLRAPANFQPSTTGIDGLDIPVGGAYRYFKFHGEGNTSVSNNEWVELEIWSLARLEPVLAAHTIEDDTGADMTARRNLQFIGATVTDDPTNDRTVVTVTGGGGGGTGSATTYREVTADTDAVAEEFIGADATAGDVVVTLPADPTAGTKVGVKRLDASSNLVTVATPGAELIDGDADATIVARWAGATFIYDGTDWLVYAPTYAFGGVSGDIDGGAP